MKKFKLNWKQNDLGLEYNIKINDPASKIIQKRLTLSGSTRKKICCDESRIWNMKSSWKQNKSGTVQSRISYLTGYLENENLLKSMTGITGSSYNFTRLSV